MSADNPTEVTPPCSLQNHYREIQALCDALGFAAQLEMGEAIQANDALARERAYGKWLAWKGMLRAIEARTDEWTPFEVDMLNRIDWSAPRFNFPGYERFQMETVEPGV